MVGTLIGQNPTSLNLETRKKNPIKNSLTFDPADAGLKLQVEDLKKRYPKAQHRAVGPCHTFNCHGLTFASRRCWVDDGSINQTIEDDGYVEVAYGLVESGDIAVYIEGGAVTHSGIVVWKSSSMEGIAPQPLILSKWGFCHEVIHKAHESPYFENATCKYYRLKE